MRLCLSTLSVAEFRAAGVLLSGEVLPLIDGNRFWDFFLTVAGSDTKAYLGTFLKAAVKLYKADKITLTDGRLEAFARSGTAIDRRKCAEAFLPQAKEADDGRLVVRLCCEDRLDLAAPLLIKARTTVSFYLLFNLLKTAEAEEIRRYAILLMRQGDSLSFRLASIIEKYFGLRPLPASFSLRIESYELSRLDGGFEAFAKTLNK